MSVRTRDEGPTRLKFFTTEQLGRTQEITPEGFLICRDVPIARLGPMVYGPHEIPVEPGRDGIVRIDRTEDELFRPETIASFEGKPVTDDHPDEDVTPDNWREYSRGTVQNVRRGANPQDDLLLADLLIMDAGTIDAVRSGKREVSCGYDANYEQIEPGRGAQRQIIGNHVAIVESGRCGPRCAIGDKHMAKTPKRTWKDRILTAFKAKDEAALEEALQGAPEDGDEGDGRHHIVVNVNGAPAATTATETEDEGGEPDDPMKVIKDALAAITARLDKLEGASSTNDDGTTGEGEGEGYDDTRTTDSAGMRVEFQDTLSRAEILAPGISLPTFDAKGSPKQTRDAMCTFRRKALKAAHTSDTMRKHVAPFVTGSNPDFGKMTCDAVRGAFIGASELAKAANNTGSKPTPAAAARANVDIISEIQKRNTDFWSNPR